MNLQTLEQWIKNHPWIASLAGLVLVYLLYQVFSGNSSSSAAAAAPSGPDPNTLAYDEAQLQAQTQLQGLSTQGSFSLQADAIQAQIQALEVNAQQESTDLQTQAALAAAELQAQVQGQEIGAQVSLGTGQLNVQSQQINAATSVLKNQQTLGLVNTGIGTVANLAQTMLMNSVYTNAINAQTGVMNNLIAANKEVALKGVLPPGTTGPTSSTNQKPIVMADEPNAGFQVAGGILIQTEAPTSIVSPFSGEPFVGSAETPFFFEPTVG